jgi:L-amino acid N-acyltransferase YncA
MKAQAAPPHNSMVGQRIAVLPASSADLEAIRRIYNEGIEDRIATLDREPKSGDEIVRWWAEHDDRFCVLVATESERIVGWVSLNRFSHRCAHADIADISVYVTRERRGAGLGTVLLDHVLDGARSRGFHKVVLHALDSNEQGRRLYRKSGRVGGRFVDVVAMEMLLP